MSTRTTAVTADRERCCGSGLCALRVPAVFDQDDDGIVVLLHPHPPETLHAEVAAAVDACPSGALTFSPSGADHRVLVAGEDHQATNSR